MISDILRALFATVLITLAATAQAQEKTATKEGFVLQPGTARILLLRPTVTVGTQTAGGVFEPNADWTAQGRENIEQELALAQAALGNQIVAYRDDTAPSAEVQQYSNLFGSVAEAVMEFQFFRGNRLPTKVRSDAFEWGLGPGVSEVEAFGKVDYILFIHTRDEIGSTGRKALQIAGLLAGVAVSSGVHQGAAGLVDARTGELVWLNADLRMGGDVRTPEGAEKRVGQLLEGFPGHAAED